MGSKAIFGLAVPKPTLRVDGPVKALSDEGAGLYGVSQEWPINKASAKGGFRFI
jgi:hypothetical protein